ncbi:hypothetical protein CI109_104337 [Kwoniella shandongensis]|uniref:Mediator of RNA polymerase II transcription subunit 13 n=1 Tax=Kwoniella shandongensis TaxID=1734106 RepID=A0A5M6BYZ8_9TREE|nr:uncharacterized protein CI109_004267 [Kwoniella shandongensis]KAA5527450.1 hypothetical protein CI109_004267 [Kwoniella shandongensis]
MGVFDVFSSEPARPSSALRGRWVVDLPSPDHPIHIRRYQATSESSKPLQDYAADPVERAWRSVNDGGNTSIRTVDKILSSPCAIVTNSPSRQLWCFSLRDDALEVEEGLEEITPRLSPITPSMIIQCTEHGHNLSCLSRTANCSVTLNTTEGAQRSWDLLASALVEKLAWRAGTRIFLSASSTVDALKPITASIRPLAANKLLLAVRPRKIPPAANTTQSHLHYILQPLGLPALLLGPSTLTPTQENRLSTSFDHLLGHSWKDGRPEARTRSYLMDEFFSDWSFFWVPLQRHEAPLSPKFVGKLSARQVVERWQKSSGIITIWPSHLARPSSSSIAPPIVQKPLPLHAVNASNPSDLMDVATGVFEFLSTYREPEVVDLDGEEGELDKDEDEDQTMDGESTIDPESVHVDVDTELDQHDVVGTSPRSKSDIDDLFSDGSNTPGPPELLDQAISLAPENPQIVEEVPNNAIELLDEEDQDVLQQNQRSARRGGTEEGPESRNEDSTNFITEDDFAFFDSPTDQTGGDGGLELDTSMDIDQPLVDSDIVIENEQKIEALVLKPSADPVAITTLRTDQNTTAATPPSPHEAPPYLTTPPPAHVHLPERNTSVPISPSVPLPSLSNTRLQPGPARPSTLDIIPSSFAAIPLPSPTSQSTFSYSLPSPAPTPESLTMRLRPPPPTPKPFDHPSYPLAWEVDYDMSDVEEEEEYTGPPTPESDYDSDTSTTGNSTPIGGSKIISQGGDDETVEFSGIRCISAAEWVRLMEGETDELEDLRKSWNPSWIQAPGPKNGTGGGILPPSPVATPPTDRKLDKSDILAQLNCERLVKELVSNQALKEIIKPTSGGENGLISIHKGVKNIVNAGVMLSDLDSETNIRSLTQPHIHTGFANNVAKLTIPSLEYWSELGLQPAGGRKDVQAVLVCEAGGGIAELGKGFLGMLAQSYRDGGFGSHDHARPDLTNEGVITAPLDGIPEAVVNLINTLSNDNVVIYVLISSFGTTPPVVLRDLFANHLLNSERTIIHLLTPSSLSSANLPRLRLSVYDRMPRPVHPISIRGRPLDEVGGRNLPHMAFTLAKRDEDNKPEFLMSWPLRSYDVMNRWKFVHATYTVNEELGFMVGFVVDSEAEAWDMKVWRLEMGTSVSERVGMVWEWARRIASEWVIEWRLSVCKVGLMSLDEIQAWRNLLSKRTAPVTLFMTDTIQPSSQAASDRIPHPRHVANITPAIITDPGTRIIDTTLCGQLTTLSNVRLPIDIPLSSMEGNSSSEEKRMTTIYPSSNFFLTLSNSISGSGGGGEGYTTTPFHTIYHNPPSGKENLGLEESQSEIGEDYYRLSTIFEKRWGIDSGLVGCVRVGMEGLENFVQIWEERGA